MLANRIKRLSIGVSLFYGLLPIAAPGSPATGSTWSALPLDPSSQPTTVLWERLPEEHGGRDSSLASPSARKQPIWQPVATDESDIIASPPVPKTQAKPSTTAKRPLLPTFGGYRDLYRGDRWYPSISTIIPMGFGPKGFMLGIGVSGSDCKIEDKTCTTVPTPSWESVQRVGSSVLDSYIGIGDPQKAIGLLITNYSQGVYRASNNQGGQTFLGGNHTGLAISRNLWQGAAIKIGAEGWFRENSPQADMPKSAFGVISQHIPLKTSSKDDPEWFTDLYITAGLGNGLFRPLDNVINAQIEEAIKAGCWYSGNCPKSVYLRGTEWGDLFPIGSIALAVHNQANLITEWTGSNLNVSLSWQPFRNIGWTITPGIGHLIQNAQYGKNYNIPACPSCDMGDAITLRPIIYLRTMLNIKF